MVASSGVYQSVRNFEMGARVVETLLRIDASQFDGVSANAFCGIVELSGTVASEYDKSQAVRFASGVPGVTTVVESLKVRPKVGIQRPAMQRHMSRVQFYTNSTNNRFDQQPHHREF